MKKRFLFTVIITVWASFVLAQTNTFTVQDSATMTSKRWRDTCFALLDLSATQVPTGYLLDYALTAFNDSNFNSLVNSNIDTLLNPGNFLMLHSILNSSTVNSSASPIGLTDSLFINASRYYRNTGNIPLMFLFQKFQKIKSTALSQNLLSLTADSFRLKDVAGRASSPYNNDLLFAFSPWKNSLTQFNSITFALPSQFWLMPGITSVQIDFGDGVGFRTLSQNGTVVISYNSSGTYLITAKINSSSGLLTAKCSFQYNKPATYIQSDSVWNFNVAPLYTSISNYISANSGLLAASNSSKGIAQPLDIVIPCSDGSIFNSANCDINPGANVYIQSGCDRVFDKPIIVVEGFDPENTTTFFSMINQLRSNPGAALDFYDLMRAQGYDFVFVIFTKNGDFIENNAMVLEQIIQKVNATKSGSNKSSIIGYSMGGLIARWALKDMENKGISHQVANYFSYDSPQQGANVPLGLQCLFNELLNDLPVLNRVAEITTLNGAFKSYAAQQMLATYASYSGSTLSGLSLNPVRAIFAQKLINLGYPNTASNYGISNGRGNNTTGGTDAGNGTQWGNFTPGASIFKGGSIFYLDNFSATAYAVPSNNTQDYILRYRFSGLKPSRIFGIPISVWAVRVRNISLLGINPYEDAPGGYERTQTQFVDAIGSKTQQPIWNTGLSITFYNSGGANSPTNFGHFGHSFIPLASALDLQNQNYSSVNNYQSGNMYYNIDNNIQNPGQVTGNTLNTPSLSPFQAVVTYTSDCAGVTCSSLTFDQLLSYNGLNPVLFKTTNWNLWHEAYISNQTALFIQRKVLGTNSFGGCTINTSLCNRSLAITGSSTVCNTATYSLSNFAGIQNLNIAWSMPNGKLAITGGQGTPSITVTKIQDGNETITVVLTNSCNQTATLTLPVVAISTPDYTKLSIVSQMPFCANVPIMFGARYNGTCAGVTGELITNFQWNVSPSPTQIVLNAGTAGCGIGNNSGVTIKFPSSPTQYNVRITAQNACGTSSLSNPYIVTLMHGGPCGMAQFTVSPNPTTGEVNITAEGGGQQAKSQDGLTSASGSKIYQVKVLDQTGNLKRQFVFPSGVTTANIDLSMLANGTYILQISDNAIWVNQKVVILK